MKLSLMSMALLATMTITACGGTPLYAPEGNYAPDAESTSKSSAADSTCPACVGMSGPSCSCAGATSPGPGCPAVPTYEFDWTIAANTSGGPVDLGIGPAGGCAGSYLCAEKSYSGAVQGYHAPDINSAGHYTWSIGSQGGVPISAKLLCPPIGGIAGTGFVFQTAYIPGGGGFADAEIVPPWGGHFTASNVFSAVLGRSGYFGTGPTDGYGEIINSGGHPFDVVYSPPGGVNAWIKSITFYWDNASIPQSPLTTSGSSPINLWGSPKACGFQTIKSNFENIYWSGSEAVLDALTGTNSAQASCAE